MGESAGPDVGLLGVQGKVDQLGHVVRHRREHRQAALRQCLHTHLQFQVGDDRHQVAVADPLAVAIDSALHVNRPGLNRGQRVGHPAAGVVVKVDADIAVHVGDHSRDRLGDVLGQGATIGVAQHHGGGAGHGRSLQHPQAELAVVAVAVEEVLGVEEHPLARRHQELHRVGHHGHPLVEGGLQRLGDVIVPALADDAYRRGSRRGQVGQHLVRVHLAPGPAGGSERHQLADLQVELRAGPGEELVVLGVGARPAPLDERDSEEVELLGDAQLVVDGE